MKFVIAERVNESSNNIRPTERLVREPNLVVQDSPARKELCVLRIHIAFCFVQGVFEVVDSDLS